MLYLNQQIGERTFPWGELFDELGEILPRGVRLRNLLPESLRKGSRAARDAGAGAQPSVALSITGIAKTEAAIYELVDALFAHPHFSAPDLKRDRRQDSGDFSFVLSVRYRGSKPGGGAS